MKTEHRVFGLARMVVVVTVASPGYPHGLYCPTQSGLARR
jgi:hypothetical protein